MENKKIIFFSILIFMIVLGVNAVSAQDGSDAISATDGDISLGDSQEVQGTVSGDVDVATVNPWNTSGELTYDIPTDAKTIKSADVYVNIYAGSAKNTYGCNANISIMAGNGVTPKYESLWIEEGSTDGVIYPVNNHTTKCYSDYMIHYDVTSLVQGLNGTTLNVKVDTFEMEDKSFDGKIKLIALVLAYDDGDNDAISYWVNSTQLWSKSNVTIPFNTEGKSGVSTLTNVVLSSGDGTYKINGEFLGDPIDHISGSYYQYNQWDVTKLVDKTKNTSLDVAYAGTGAYGSIKNVLSVLKIDDIQTNMSLLTEYTASSNTVLNAFAGTNNTITVTVSTSKAGKYTVKLFADGVMVNETEVSLDNSSKAVLLTDPTIRPVDESTVNGADNPKVDYTAELLLDGVSVNSSSINVPIRYNGYLGKDLAYPAGGMEALDTIVINGDIVVDVKTEYLSGAGNLNKTDIWNINLDENSTIVRAFAYVPYTWCNPTQNTERLDMFNVTFNGANITAIALYRDQSNLGGASGAYGYGVLVYDVTGLIKKNDNNTLYLSKNATYPGVYSSALVYMYNTTSSNYIKEIYINHGADILYNSYNKANRPVKSDSTFIVDSKLTSDAKLYVFASNAQNNYVDVVFNGEAHANVFNASSYQTSYYELDVTGKVKDSNAVSVVSTKGTFLALHQIMVLTKDLDDVEISLAPEYTGTAYAGTNNAITVTIEALKAGKFNATLLANGVEVNKTEIDLVAGTNKFVLIDPTIRPVDESTVNGANNTKVDYTLQLSSGDNATITVSVLYNGNLGKDLAYPAGGMVSFINVTFTGSGGFDIKDESTYLSAADMNRTDVFNVNLDSKTTTFAKALIFIPYNWFNPKLGTEDVTMFNVTFNDVAITPIAWYRDQSNLGGYGRYGYGEFIYDVTDLIVIGNNTLVLNKNVATPAVYPSMLMCMYNTTGSPVVLNAYISAGADLLSGTSNNVAGRIVKADSTIDIEVADYADLYVFAASAQKGEGNLIVNGNVYEDVWAGSSKTTDVFDVDITDSVKNSNNISFVATGSTILALHQMIVTTKKAASQITAPGVTKVYNVNKNLVITLKDSEGNGIPNAEITVVINNVEKTYTTNAKGQVSVAISNLAPKTYTAKITFDGNDDYLKSSANAKIVVKKATPKLTAKAKTFKVSTKIKKYTVTLKTNKNKVMKNAKVTLKVNGKTYSAKTNSKGQATFKITKLTKTGKFTAVVKYAGNNCYNAKTVKSKITVNK
ncbi:DUF3344 domain-containing protein [Methanobrevibacter sp.]|uniref:DUF3344 domain-containing protein n=1 Tax=Methanobrevibacter sp. TaxID=66852 RepID=UPI00388CFA8D